MQLHSASGDWFKLDLDANRMSQYSVSKRFVG